MIDWDRPVRTRDGRKVRIYATDCGGFYPVHGAYSNGKEWYPESWTEKGQFRRHESDNEFDLENIPEKREGWINIYPIDGDLDDHLWPTRQKADQFARSDRIKCIHIEYEV